MQKITWSSLSQNGEAFHLARWQTMSRETSLIHTQDYPEIFWIEQGRALHRINGQDKRLDTGDLIWIRSSDKHGFLPLGTQGFILTNLAFAQETADHLQDRYFSGVDDYFRFPGLTPRRFKLHPDRLKSLRKWTTYLDRAPKTHFELDRFLIDLLHRLETATPAETSETDLPDWLQEAINQFNEPEHFTEGTAALARLAGRTPEHVNATLKKLTDRTASDTVNRIRMDYAAGQLRISTKKILEICFDAGFENLGHFYKVFKSRYGMTPRTYRLRHQTAVGR